ncbi:AAA family ATPase [Acuticoccus sp. M5D2P5]|uniref:AAA family ATPase n=1 Tax=Acuticoccus kalidii TaxID=2910977 RepID=UPI001F3332D8|nr:AAA family ATPase [Acuticoccus kalidii]MCF3934720.1 AAA family ATPase [Acuticoccus kalidii]
MRFSAINLSRYGQFEEAAFDFARRDGSDLHLVVGANEAGKTTLKHALVDFLFGVPLKNPPYSFRYGRRQMVIEAAIEVAGEAYRLERTTGRSGNLQPVDAADALAAALGDMTREAFLLTQAFSHDEMREHADALNESRGDLRDLLMRDAGGLAQAVATLDVLRKEADGLFQKRKNAKAEYNQLEQRWEEAGQRYRAHELSAAGHADLRRAFAEAEEALHALRREEEEARAKAGRLKGLIEVAPRVDTVTRLEAALAEDDAPRLAPNAVERLRAADEEPALRERLRQSEVRLAECDEAIAALVPDEAVLSLGPDIEALERDASRSADREEVRAAQTTRREDALRLARRTARDLGLRIEEGEADAGAIAATLTPAIDRAALAEHLAAREGHEQAVRYAEEMLEARRVEAPQVTDRPTAEPLAAALAEARALGDVRALWRDEAAAYREARAADEDAARSTAGDPVATSASPPPDEGAAAEAAIEEAARRRERAEDRVHESAEALAVAEETLKAERRADLPTEDRLVALRAARDALWREARAGRALAEIADDYEARVAEADATADARFDHVEALTAERRAAANLAETKARHAEREKALAACRADYDRLVAAWRERLGAAGIAPPPADYAAWFARRKTRLDAAQALANAERRIGEVRQRSRRLLAALEAALGDPPSEDLDGKALVAAIEAALARAEAAREADRAAAAEEKAARETFEKAERERPALEKARHEAGMALAAWREAWEAMAARAGLAPDIAPRQLKAWIDGEEAIEAALDRAAEANGAIRDADAAAAASAAETRRLAGLLDEAEIGGTAVMTRRLVERLRRAEALLAKREELGAERERLAEEVRTAKAAHEAVRALIAADLATAGLPADAALAVLQEAARRSDKRHADESALAAARSEVEAAGFAFPAIVATLAEDEQASRIAAHEAANDTLALLKSDIESAHEAFVMAREALRRAEADSAAGTAAEAAFERATLAGEMAEVAHRAILRRIEATVLRAARDAFAAENRSPILDRAAANFAAFTDNVYDRLDVDDGPEGGFLRAHRVTDNQLVDVTQMSAGTRDQLVASVRFAAAADCPLPFLADDLFVNADNQRTASGFRLLAALAEGRQVIYFTHHSHVADLARDTLGSGLSVLELT